MIAAVAILFFVDGFLTAVAFTWEMFYIFRHRSLPNLPGIPAVSGPFVGLGIDALFVAGLIFILVSALKILAAFWLWNSRVDGAVLGLILIGVSAVFWYGFELPLPPLVAAAEVVLVILTWSSLR